MEAYLGAAKNTAGTEVEIVFISPESPNAGKVSAGLTHDEPHLIFDQPSLKILK
jgi:hypothetical protein